MLVKVATGTGAPDGIDVDVDDDGVLDGDALTWTIYDSVSIIDADGGSTDYGQIVFARADDEDVDPIVASTTLVTNQTTDPVQNVVVLGQDPQWYGRQGESIGYAATTDGADNDDWFAARINSNSAPEWGVSSNILRLLPSNLCDTYTSAPISTFGSENPNFNAATTSSDDVLASEFSVYP